MKVYYNVEIQMAGKYEASDELVRFVKDIIGIDDTDIDECETYRAAFFFCSSIYPSAMAKRVWRLINTARDSKNHENMIHYVDVIYRWEAEMNADRFVCWSDGKMKEYTGHIVFEEDE